MVRVQNTDRNRFLGAGFMQEFPVFLGQSFDADSVNEDHFEETQTSTPPDPKEIQKAMAKADLTRDYMGMEGEIPSILQRSKEQKKSLWKTVLTTMGLSLGALGLPIASAGLLYNAGSIMNRVSHSEATGMEVLQVIAGGIAGALGALGSCGLGIGLIAFLSNKKERKAFKDDFMAFKKLTLEIQKAKRLSRQTFNVIPETAPEAQSLQAELKNKMFANTQTLAQKLKTAHDENPLLQEELRTLFPQGSPDTDSLKVLLRYYAYQWIILERQDAGFKVTSPGVSELEITKRMFVLSDMMVHSGELFHYVEPTTITSQKGALEQQFNRALVPPLMVRMNELDLEVERKLSKFQDFHREEASIQRYMTIAKRALLAASLSSGDRSREITQLKEIIEGFQAQRVYREKLREDQEIKLSDQGLSSLEGCQEKLQRLIFQLQSVLQFQSEPLSSGKESGDDLTWAIPDALAPNVGITNQTQKIS